jgi:hypothetical protein
MQRFKELVGQF